MTVPGSARTRVLLIDDDEKLNPLLAEYLGQFNFSVEAVIHPDDGLRAFIRCEHRGRLQCNARTG